MHGNRHATGKIVSQMQIQGWAFQALVFLAPSAPSWCVPQHRSSCSPTIHAVPRPMNTSIIKKRPMKFSGVSALCDTSCAQRVAVRPAHSVSFSMCYAMDHGHKACVLSARNAAQPRDWRDRFHLLAAKPSCMLDGSDCNNNATAVHRSRAGSAWTSCILGQRSSPALSSTQQAVYTTSSSAHR